MITLRDLENEVKRLHAHAVLDRRVLDRLNFVDVEGQPLTTFDDGRGGYVWPGVRSIVWAEGEYEVPESWKDYSVYFRFVAFGDGPILPEGMFFLDGKLYQGLDRFHGEVLLSGDAAVGKHSIKVKFWDWEDRTLLGLAAVEIVAIDAEIEALATDIERAVERLKEDKIADQTAWMQAMGMAVLCMPGSGRPSIESVREASVIIKKVIYNAEPGSGPTVICAGHSHIDIIWLWPLATTRDKCLHTFATVLRFMEEYPEYVFTQSQPQLYEYVRQDNPELYEAIAERIAEGRWEAEGALWVEPDMNIPSGESLVRQLVHGKRFYKDEFGIESRVAWLPDVFGYTAALPQLLAGADVPYFVTSKLSWNQTNRYPHDTFRWRGIDGTEVLAYFITTPNFDTKFATSYAGFLTAKELRETWGRYREQALNNETILPFGHGDGGGGPTREMLESMRRFQAMPALPHCRPGKVLPFLERVNERVQGHPDLPVWDGELYFELHRGTFTSQAWIKRANRLAEIGLFEAEMCATLTYIAGDEYPEVELDQAWKLVLLNQFHDVLPGSSIKQVYDEARPEYEEVQSITSQITQKALVRLSAGNNAEGEVVLFNQLPWSRTSYIELSSQDVELFDVSGKPVARQSTSAGTLFAVKCDALGTTSLKRQSAQFKLENIENQIDEIVGCTVSPDGRRLSNHFYELELDENGEIVSLIDKLSQRSPLTGNGNCLKAYDDKPLSPLSDAWDIDLGHEQRPLPIAAKGELKVVENGPLRVVVEVTRQLFSSSWKQRISIYRDIPRIDFHTIVDWRERRTLLKVHFPINVRTTHASYEIQCGSIERPTHRNTSWDENRFEVPAHRWADLSEYGYGVSILNDCKYGYSALGNELALTLLKSATMPDSEADQGHHEFTYSLYAHEGDWRNLTVRQAAELNMPPLLVEGAENSEATFLAPWIKLDAQGFQLMAFKKAEKSDAVVLRGYEAHGGSETVRVDLGFPVRRVVETNLLEREIAEIPLPLIGNSFSFKVQPYQIRTFLIELETK